MVMTAWIDVTPEGLEFTEHEAYAIVGRPLTPVSYAGMARRTSRRVARRTVYRTGAYMNTLPSGCGYGGGYYACGGVHYRPYYQGANLVYIRVD